MSVVDAQMPLVSSIVLLDPVTALRWHEYFDGLRIRYSFKMHGRPPLRKRSACYQLLHVD